ncbi:MAG: hypothetical protein HY548_03150 [Elusimicrobia bacterium]|nr:hypothetical protein [Elusimicrobiota bacterium]
MKRNTLKSAKRILVSLFLFAGLSHQAWATPSTTYWTPAVIDIQGYGVGHVTYDNYTTVSKKGPARGGQTFANDVGLTVGVLPFQKVQMEVGFDWLEPTDYPLYFNAKIGAPEGALFEGAPALQVGVFNVGTKKDVTNQNIFQFVTGRSLPSGLGRLHLGAYTGNEKLLLNSKGEKENSGLMAGYDRGFWTVESPEGSYSKIIFAGDYASGDNALGGGGVGLYYFFNKNTSLLTGPVWFNEKTINGEWKWTTQLDVNF